MTTGNASREPQGQEPTCTCTLDLVKDDNGHPMFVANVHRDCPVHGIPMTPPPSPSPQAQEPSEQAREMARKFSEEMWEPDRELCICNLSRRIDALAAQRVAEATRQARELLLLWLDKQGHDRCWYYPEILQQLATLFDVKPTRLRGLPPRAEFEAGCKRYADEQYSEMTSP